jgi:hypothetical protein
VLQAAVARDHRQGVRRRALHHLFGVAERDHRSANPPVLREGLAREPLARRGPEEVLEAGVGKLLPVVVERRLDPRGARGVLP